MLCLGSHCNKDFFLFYYSFGGCKKFNTDMLCQYGVKELDDLGFLYVSI